MHRPSSAAQPARIILLLAVAHGLIDMSSKAVVTLLPALRQQFSLSYTLVAVITLVLYILSSVAQPLFGLISDRLQKRWLLPVGLIVCGTGLALMGLMPTYGLVLAAVAVVAVGNGIFHPEGAMMAYGLGGARQARTMSKFGFGGQLGHSMGPLYAVLLVALGGGLGGTVWAVLPVLAMALLMAPMIMAWNAAQAQQGAAERAARREGLPETNRTGTIVLMLVVTFRAVIHLGVASFIPFFWIDALGNDPATAGYVQFVYLAGGATGTLLGTPFADRLGAKRLLITSFGLLLPVQLVLTWLTDWALIAGLFAAGFLSVSTHMVTLIMAQKYMPRNVGLASGLSLGVAFGLGGLGTMAMGLLADQWGMMSVMRSLTFLVPFPLLLSLALPPETGHGAGAGKAAVARV